MRSIEVSAKTVDEAVKKGLAELALSIDEVNVEVIAEAEAGSFLGIGRKPAIVRLTVVDKAVATDETVASGAMPTTAQEGEEAVSLPVGFADYVEIEKSEDQPYSDKTSSASEPLHKAAHFLQGILNNLHLEDTLSYSETDDVMHFNITGEDCGILIGRRGDTLRSLQYLLSLVVHQAGSDKRVILDIGDYYEKRKEALVNLAKRTARRSLLTGNAYELNPMRSLDRRIIHETLSGVQGIVTYSEGEDPNRYVVIDLGEDYTPEMPLPAELADAAAFDAEGTDNEEFEYEQEAE